MYENERALTNDLTMNDYIMEIDKIYCGHALEILRTMPNGFVDCCITSPPYWALRSYQTEPIIWDGDPSCQHQWVDSSFYIHRGSTKSELASDNKGIITEGVSDNAICAKCGAWTGSLGLESNFELYISHLIQIFSEVKRVLKPTGSIFVDLGDTYSGGQSGSGGDCGKHSNDTQYGQATRFDNGIRKEGVPPKSLCMIPFRFAIAMVDAGWCLRNDIIWHKPNGMPNAVKDRFTIDFEHIFFFVKSRKYYFNQQFEPSIDPESYEGRRKRNPRSIPGPTKFDSIKNFHKRTGKKYPMRNRRAVWTIPTEPSHEKHYAQYPQKLIEPLILAGCPPDGIVLDPFLGSGTTAIVAKELGRHWVGIELNREYVEIAERRIKATGYQADLL